MTGQQQKYVMNSAATNEVDYYLSGHASLGNNDKSQTGDGENWTRSKSLEFESADVGDNTIESQSLDVAKIWRIDGNGPATAKVCSETRLDETYAPKERARDIDVSTKTNGSIVELESKGRLSESFKPDAKRGLAEDVKHDYSQIRKVKVGQSDTAVMSESKRVIHKLDFRGPRDRTVPAAGHRNASANTKPFVAMHLANFHQFPVNHGEEAVHVSSANPQGEATDNKSSDASGSIEYHPLVDFRRKNVNLTEVDVQAIDGVKHTLEKKDQILGMDVAINTTMTGLEFANNETGDDMESQKLRQRMLQQMINDDPLVLSHRVINRGSWNVSDAGSEALESQSKTDEIGMSWRRILVLSVICSLLLFATALVAGYIFGNRSKPSSDSVNGNVGVVNNSYSTATPSISPGIVHRHHKSNQTMTGQNLATIP